MSCKKNIGVATENIGLCRGGRSGEMVVATGGGEGGGHYSKLERVPLEERRHEVAQKMIRKSMSKVDKMASPRRQNSLSPSPSPSPPPTLSPSPTSSFFGFYLISKLAKMKIGGGVASIHRRFVASTGQGSAIRRISRSA